MATTKPRINITTEPDVERALRSAAKRDSMPIATKATELLMIGLELEEDIALASIADARAADKSKFISHDQAWQ